jgi:GNAT superfamily N-acetyltransferase
MSRMVDYTIRPAEPRDAEELANAWMEFGRYYEALDPDHFRVPERAGLEEWFASLLQPERGSDEIWLVAEGDEGVLGYVMAEVSRPDEDAAWQLLRDVVEPTLQIHALVVLEPHRRKGIGTALMQAVEEWAKDRGVGHAFLMTSSASPSAIPFYEEFGYMQKITGYWKRLSS